MIEPWAAASADGAPDLFCERCGSPARPDGALLRVGLTTCRACGIHACQRCWARSVGACPACGVTIEATSMLRSLRGTDRAATVSPAPPAPRSSRTHSPRAATLTAVAILLAVGATAFAFIPRPVPPVGGVAGIASTPGAGTRGAAGPGSSTTPPVSAEPATPTGRPPAGPGRGDVAGDVSDGPSAGAGSSGPDPTPTPRVTPGPTRAPTPEPTGTPAPEPTPTSAPTPTPCFAVAPRLIGELRSDARQIWADAGFTGRVIALGGRGNYVIGSQSRTAGHNYPCDSNLTIGPA